MKKITILQAHRVMLNCFHNLYLQTKNDDIAGMMGGASLYSADTRLEPQTMDPAVWHDWMDGVKIILHDKTITFDSNELTIEQAYQTMHQYFVIYCDIGSIETIAILRDLMNKDSDHVELSKWLRIKWDKSLEYILQEELPDKIGHFVTGDTTLKFRESFMVMKIFLNQWCQKKEDKQIIKLVKSMRFKSRKDYWNDVPDIINIDIFKTWTQTIQTFMKQKKINKLTVFTAYKSMPIFLNTYFKHPSIEINNLINSFDVTSKKRFLMKSLSHDWLHSVIEVNDEQTEIIDNLLTINTPIDENIAKNIIKEFLKKFIEKSVLDQLFAENLASQNLWRKALRNIKKKKRSYLLFDNEVTILEAYYVMVNLLELIGQPVNLFQLNENGQPADFLILLNWLKVCEEIYK